MAGPRRPPSPVPPAARLLAAWALLAAGMRPHFGSDGGAGAAPQESCARKTRSVKIRAFWVRHGESCANALGYQLDSGNSVGANVKGLMKIFYDDPGLTSCGIARATAYGPQIYKKILKEFPDWVGRVPLFSSRLVRAMETALYSFPELMLYPIPDIAEKGPTADNKAEDWDKQAEKMRRQNDEEVMSRIIFLSKVNPSGLKGSTDYSKFLEHFPVILERLAESGAFKAPSKMQPGSTMPVIIVSHSHFMRDELACEKGKDRMQKPRNNEVWAQDYLLSLDTGKLQATDCGRLFLPRFFPERPALICAASLQRCREDKLPNELLARHNASCQEHQDPICGGNILTEVPVPENVTPAPALRWVDAEPVERSAADGLPSIRCCCDAAKKGALYVHKGRTGRCVVLVSNSRAACGTMQKDAKLPWFTGDRTLHHYKKAGMGCMVAEEDLGGYQDAEKIACSQQAPIS